LDDSESITYVTKRTDDDAGLAHTSADTRVPSVQRIQRGLNGGQVMLWTILIVLLLLWLVGFYGGFVTNSLIHLLLVGALVVLALNLFKKRNPA
jgi:hypothetical protein